MSVWISLFYGSAGAAILLVVISLIYTFMLYDSGNRQMTMAFKWLLIITDFSIEQK